MPKPTKDKEIADLKADIAVALKIHGQMGEFNKKIVKDCDSDCLKAELEKRGYTIMWDGDTKDSER